MGIVCSPSVIIKLLLLIFHHSQVILELFQVEVKEVVLFRLFKPFETFFDGMFCQIDRNLVVPRSFKYKNWEALGQEDLLKTAWG